MEGYCSIIITSDSVRDRIEKSLIKEIVEKTGSQIIWSKYLKIEKDAVGFLYSRKVGRPYYSSIVENITAGYSLLVILRGQEDIATEVQRLKGRFRVDKEGNLEVDGLRLKYGARINKNENKEGDSDSEVYEFRLHASDNLEGAALICAVLMDVAELESLKQLAPPLYFEAQKFRYQITV